MTDSERLDRIIRETLELDDGRMSDVAYGVTPAWDSVAHLMLVAAIEEEFRIRLEGDDVAAMTDVAAIRRILRERHGLDVGDPAGSAEVPAGA